MKGYNLMGRKLYVGNLSFDTTDQMLQESFSPYGEITSTTVIMDRETNRSKGFGFVEFAQDADAQKAKGAMDGKDLGGRSLRVDEAKELKEREPRSGGYGSGRSSRY
jgi:cold-inducible RNA-binding protein